MAFILLVQYGCAASAVASCWTLAKCVNHSQCLGVVDELLDIWIVMRPSSLSLTAEEVLKGVLAYSLAKK